VKSEAREIIREVVTKRGGTIEDAPDQDGVPVVLVRIPFKDTGKFVTFYIGESIGDKTSGVEAAVSMAFEAAEAEAAEDADGF